MSLNGSPSAPVSGRSIPLTMFVVAMLVVGGLAIVATAAYFELRPSGGTHSPSSMTITDDLGRSVTVPSNPGRVVALGGSIVDSLARLGLRSHLVGVDCYAPAIGGISSDYSSDQIALWNLTTAMCVETGPTFNVESLLNLSPQLVLASTIVSAAAVEQIQGQFHIPVLMVQPSTLGGIEVDLTILGQIFGVASTAAHLNGQLQAVLGEATNVSANVSASFAPLPTVLLTYYVDPANQPEPGYFSYGPGTFGESLIELASGASISANATLPYPLLTGDQVLVADPQVIVVATGYGQNVSSYAAGPDWSSFGAVQNHTVFGLDSNDLTEPGPTMILEGLPLLLHVLHPSLVPSG